jgi:PRMT5 arginine-N-methyltransferase
MARINVALMIWLHPRTLAFSHDGFKRQTGNEVLPRTRTSLFVTPSISTTGDEVISRRDVVMTSILGRAIVSAGAMLGNSLPARANERVSVPISASWKAVDGLTSLDSQSQFVSFDVAAYRAMKDDPTRTPLFQKAIETRLGKNPQSMTVLDLGTGPFALFALIAAEAGAGRVYAIEANPEAAQSARMFVKRAGYEDIVVIIEGFSTLLSLPEKADFCIAEVVGSIASEEGAYATIRDAHARFMKDPMLDSSWIPSRIQTYAAPASYSLHTLFGPPEFDWTKLNGQPVRFNCRDQGLELLSDPLLVEDISFANIFSQEQGKRNKRKEFTFTIDAERIKMNTMTLYDVFRRGNSSVRDSEILALKTAHSMSGVALWPRLLLDDTIVVDSRHYEDGAHQRSHWQTVLPIMSDRPVSNLQGGERVNIACDFSLPVDILKPPVYSIRGSLQYTQ